MKKFILDQALAAKKLERMALEIAERNTDATHLILAGISENGNIIATKLVVLIKKFFDGQIDLVTISLNKKMPDFITIDPILDFNNKVVIVIDDVANSGKTIMYALKPFLNFHPQKIQALVMVDRTHKTFPIQPDYIGLSVATTLQEHIYVEIENEEIIGAYMI